MKKVWKLVGYMSFGRIRIPLYARVEAQDSPHGGETADDLAAAMKNLNTGKPISRMIDPTVAAAEQIVREYLAK